jgi:hypothetical protein
MTAVTSACHRFREISGGSGVHCAEESHVLCHEEHSHQSRRSERHRKARAEAMKGDDVKRKEQAAADGDQRARLTRTHGTFATTYWIS